MMVVGEKEMENNEVSLRRQGRGDLGSMPLEEAINRLIKEISDRKDIE
jgi:threonyl-tRNA synthetase